MRGSVAAAMSDKLPAVALRPALILSADDAVKLYEYQASSPSGTIGRGPGDL
jgi:hypothetical protein